MSATCFLIAESEDSARRLTTVLEGTFAAGALERSTFVELEERIARARASIVVAQLSTEAAARELVRLSRDGGDTIGIIVIAPEDLAEEVACLRRVYASLTEPFEDRALIDALEHTLGVVLEAAG